MSSDPEFDRLCTWIMDNSQVKGELSRQEWETWMARRLRLIYVAGAKAGLSHQYGRLDTTVARVRWLAECDLVNVDVTALLDEVEQQREQAGALQGTYGVTDSTIRSMIAEGFHTAFRKAADSVDSAIAWKAIRDMDREEWGAILDFTVNPLIEMLREAETQDKAASGRRAYEQYYRNADQEPPPWDLESETVRQGWTAIAVAAAVRPPGQEITP